MRKIATIVMQCWFALFAVGCAQLAPVSGTEIDQKYPNRLDFQMIQTKKQFSDRFCCAGSGDVIMADKHYFFRR